MLKRSQFTEDGVINTPEMVKETPLKCSPSDYQSLSPISMPVKRVKLSAVKPKKKFKMTGVQCDKEDVLDAMIQTDASSEREEGFLKLSEESSWRSSKRNNRQGN
jgi:hypothetical protein